MKVVWAVGGAAVAIVVLYQVGRARSAYDSAARTLTPGGLTDALTSGVEELRAVGRELAAAMREQEGRLSADLLAPPEEVAQARTDRAARAALPGRRRASSDPDPWDVDDEF